MSINITTKPTVWVIVRRYDQPLRYGFHEWIYRTSRYSVKDLPQYHEETPSLLDPEKSQDKNLELTLAGFVEYTGPWNDDLERIVAGSCPIEFLKGLRDRESNVMDRLTILTKGEAEEETPKVYGQCLHCGAIEVELVNGVACTKDLSYMGESPVYPFGYGCELCA